MNLKKLYHVINEALELKEEKDRYSALELPDGDWTIWDWEKEEYVDNAYYSTKEEALKVVNDLLNNTNVEENNDMIQCVLKIEDIGNSYSFQGIIEDNSHYESEYDMENEYSDRFDGEDPTIFPILAYHKDGENEFYDEAGAALDLDMDNYKDFKKESEKPLKNPTVPNSKEDIA